MKANAPIALILFALVGTGCSSGQKVPPPPPPPSNWVENPGVTPLTPGVTKPVRKDDWLGLSVINANWRWVKEGPLSVARLTLASGRERMAFTCDPATRQVSLTVDQVAASGLVSITTTALSRDVPLAPNPAGSTSIRLAFNARDPLLDAIAFSRGRFMVSQAGSTPDVAPVQAEISRVIEDCR